MFVSRAPCVNANTRFIYLNEKGQDVFINQLSNYTIKLTTPPDS